MNAFSDAISLIDAVSPRREVVWNFRNLLTGGCGTIEFRRPFQVITEQDAKDWIASTLSFIRHILQIDFTAPAFRTTNTPTISDLRDAVGSGARSLGPG